KNGVPEDIPAGLGAGLVESISIVTDGKIIVTPKEQNGFEATDTYELIPTIKNNRLIWNSGGGGVKNGYAH
ncbi:MAG: pilus assembly protein PilA, partial [Candidatus Komeilibacteria bacterium]